METIIAVDQSLSCSGMACLRNGVYVKGTALHTKKLRGAQRLLWIADKVFGFYTKHSGDVLVMEGYSFGSRGRATFSLGELGGVIKYEAFKRGIPLFVVPPTSWKKAILGKGNLKKDQILKEVYKKYKVDFDDDNIADAYCIARFMEGYTNWSMGDREFFDYQVETFNKYEKMINEEPEVAINI